MKSFLQGKKMLDVAPLRAPQPGAPTSNVPNHAAHAVVAGSNSPQIDVIKQGDKVIRIVVTCSCGERTEIECLYPPGQ